MSPFTWILLLPLLAGLVIVIRGILETGATRLLWPCALLITMSVAALVLPAPPMAPLRELMVDPAVHAWLEKAAIAVMMIGVALAITRSIRERDRAETVHWDGMEAVRVLAEVERDVSQRPIPLDEHIEGLLAAGCHATGLDAGFFARLVLEPSSLRGGDVLELGAIFGEGFETASGDDSSPLLGVQIPLHKTVLERLPRAEETLQVDAAAQGREPFRVGDQAWIALLAVPVRHAGETLGVLVFGSERPPTRRLGAAERRLLELMATSLGQELGLDAILRAKARASEAASPRRRLERRSPSVDRRRLDVRAAIKQLEQALAASLGEARELRLDLAPDLPAVRLYRYAFDRVLWSLVLHAKEATHPGAPLWIEASELASAPGHAAAGFVTLALRATGPALDLPALVERFEAGQDVDGTERALPSSVPRLSLLRTQRLLQDAGGDLSVSVEADVGTTLTAYLPIEVELPEEDLPLDEAEEPDETSDVVHPPRQAPSAGA